MASAWRETKYISHKRYLSGSRHFLIVRKVPHSLQILCHGEQEAAGSHREFSFSYSELLRRQKRMGVAVATKQVTTIKAG